MKTEQTNLFKAAQIVSVIGHPFVLLPLTTVIATLQNASPARAFTISGVTVLATVFPLLFIIRRRVKAGKWSDHDVSERSERGNFYTIVIIIVALSSVLFWFLNFPRPLLLGMIISLFLLVTAMIINRRSKISLHLIFAFYCAVSLIAVGLWIGVGFILLAITVGFSRVILKRHTTAQVVSGALLGAAAGIFLLKMINFI
ncbi:MAG: phosphatase PAP2 family protein [Pyrinomonadaceae bacterium]